MKNGKTMMTVMCALSLILTGVSLITVLCGPASAETINIIPNPYFEGPYTEGLAKNWTIWGTAYLSENTNPNYALYSSSQRINTTANTGCNGIRYSFYASANKSYFVNVKYYLASGLSKVEVTQSASGYDTQITPKLTGWNEANFTCNTITAGMLYIYITSANNEAVDMYVSHASVDNLSVYMGTSQFTQVNRTMNVTVYNLRGVATQVNYSTVDGGATAGVDYTATSGTLTFSAGQLQQNISITIANVSVPPQKVFYLRLTGTEVSFSKANATIYIRPPGGIIFSFDDHTVTQWYAEKNFLQSINGKISMSVNRAHILDVDNSTNRLLEMQAIGCEIVNHGTNHIATTAYSGSARDYAAYEIIANEINLTSRGFAKSPIFVYPTGATTKEIDNEVLKWVPAIRGIEIFYGEAINATPTAYYQWDNAKMIYVAGVSNYDNRTLANIYAGMDKAKADCSVLVFMGHNISNSGDIYSIPPATFEAIMQYAHDNDIEFYTFRDIIISDSITYTPLLNNTPTVMQPARVFANGTTRIQQQRVIPNVSVDMQVYPSAGYVDVNVTQWNATKAWTESSETHNIVTQHVIRGFPANALIQITRDGLNYTTVRSDNTGSITWAYSGGYSEHAFEAFVTSEIVGMKISASNIWSDGVAFMVVVILVILSMAIVGLLQGKKISAANISELVMGLMIVSFVVTVGYGVLSAMSGII